MPRASCKNDLEARLKEKENIWFKLRTSQIRERAIKISTLNLIGEADTKIFFLV